MASTDHRVRYIDAIVGRQLKFRGTASNARSYTRELEIATACEKYVLLQYRRASFLASRSTFDRTTQRNQAHTAENAKHS